MTSAASAICRQSWLRLCTPLAMLLAGCGSSRKITPSEIVVTIDAERGVRSAAAALSITAEGSSGVAALDRRNQRYANSIKPIEFPKTIAFLPLGGDDKRVFVLTATAVDDQGADIATARMISGYVPGEVRYARLLIEDSCRDKTCGELETCTGAICKDAKVGASKLSTIASKPTDVQHATPSAAGGSGNAAAPAGNAGSGATTVGPAGASGAAGTGATGATGGSSGTGATAGIGENAGAGGAGMSGSSASGQSGGGTGGNDAGGNGSAGGRGGTGGSGPCVIGLSQIDNCTLP